MDYEQFIQMLKMLDNTEQILITLFNYFKDNVEYNYDELQVVKYIRYEEGPLREVYDLIAKNEKEKSQEFKEYLIKRLDDAFLQVEGRPLSERNKYEWFKNYGTIIHHDAQPAKNGIIKIHARDARDEVIQIQPHPYAPEYKNGLLVNGVCGEYSRWIKQICNDLGIGCFIVKGKGTTGHAWNLIYIQEKDVWINFDMTMVRFYLDGWATEYGRPEDWIFATNKKMFEMQPQRIVEQIIGDHDTVLLNSVVTSEKQGELDSFLQKFCRTEKFKK